MRKIQIICDSSCDLSQEEAKQLGIVIQPLAVSFDATKSYRDGVDIDVDTLFAKVDELGKTPKTSAMNTREYYKLFEEYLAKDCDIIYTGIASGISSSYYTGCMVAKDLAPNNIEVVDSQNLSTGIALIIFKALKWIEEGKDVHEVARLMREQAPLIRSQFAIDTMDFLHKGGRCSGMVKLIGTFLKIKPVILVRDNQMIVGAKPRGKVIVGIDKMLEMLEEDKDNVDTDLITITHSKADQYVSYTKERIEQIIPGVRVMVTNAGAIVSSHCGPGTLGIFYSLKKQN